MDIVHILFSFKGRISRLTYWVFTIILSAIILIPLTTFIDIDSPEADRFVLLMAFILLWPSLAIQAKRWHDRDKSAIWILINFVPFIGGIWAFIENALLPGTSGENHYGPDPLHQVSNDSQQE